MASNPPNNQPTSGEQQFSQSPAGQAVDVQLEPLPVEATVDDLDKLREEVGLLTSKQMEGVPDSILGPLDAMPGSGVLEGRIEKQARATNRFGLGAGDDPHADEMGQKLGEFLGNFASAANNWNKAAVWGTFEFFKNAADFAEAAGVGLAETAYNVFNPDKKIDLQTGKEQGQGNVNLMDYFGFGDMAPQDAAEHLVSTAAPAMIFIPAGGEALGGLGLASGAGLSLPTTGVVGAAAQTTAKILPTLISDAAYWGTATDRDRDNLSSWLKDMEDTPGVVGDIARNYFRNIPGTDWLAHQNDDSELMKGLKDATEAGVTSLIAPTVYATLKLGGAAKLALEDNSAAAREWLSSGAWKGEWDKVRSFWDDLNQELSSKEYIDKLFKQGKELSTNEALDTVTKPGAGSLTDAELSRPTLAEKIKLVKQEMEDRVLKRALDLEAADAKATAFIDAKKRGVESEAFQSEKFGQFVANSKDKVEAFKHFGDFVDKDIPLLDDKTATLFGKELVDNIFGTLKPLIRSGDMRAEEGAKILQRYVEMDTNTLTALLNDTAKAADYVRNTDYLVAANKLAMRFSIAPQLEQDHQALILAVKNFGVESVEAELIRDKVQAKIEAMHLMTEAIDRIQSGAGLLLQGAQMDAKYAKLVKGVMPGAEEGAAAKAYPLFADFQKRTQKKLSIEETLAALDLFSKVKPSEIGPAGSGIFRATNHPAWGVIKGTYKLGDKCLGTLSFSAMLFNAKTFVNVGLASGVSQFVMSSRKMLGHAFLEGQIPGMKTFGKWARAVIDETERLPGMGAEDALIAREASLYGEKLKLMRFPSSMGTGVASLVRKDTRDVWSMGVGDVGKYADPNPLSNDSIRAAYGDKAADTLKNWGKGYAQRILDVAGSGMGIGSHSLSIWDTMLKHSAVTGQIAENLYMIGRKQGLTGKALDKFIFDHERDVVDDFVLANLQKGDIPMSNKLGFNADAVRQMGKTGEVDAAKVGLRAGSMGINTNLTGNSSSLDDTFVMRGTNAVAGLFQKFSTTLRADLAPFPRVVGNMVHQGIAPVQGWVEVLGRRFTGNMGLSGSDYIQEVLRGHHGVKAQEDLYGSMLMGLGLSAAGMADAAWNYIVNEPTLPPIGRAAQNQARAAGDLEYGDIRVGNSKISAPWLWPYAGTYTATDQLADSFLRQQDISPEVRANQMITILDQTLGVSSLFQTPADMVSSVLGGSDVGDGTSAWKSALNAYAAMKAKQLSRPVTNLTLLGLQHRDYGRTLSIRNETPGVAFQSGLTPLPWSDDRRFHPIAYDMGGKPIPDSYNPGTPSEYIKGLTGFRFRTVDMSPWGRLRRDMEENGMAFKVLDKKVSVGGGDSPRLVGQLQPVDVDTQTFYNSKTNQHLWDVYNGYVNEFRDISQSNFTDIVDKNGKVRYFTVEEQLDQIAEAHQKVYGNLKGSELRHIHGDVQRILSYPAALADGVLDKAHAYAASKMRTYIVEHADEYESIVVPGMKLRTFIQQRSALNDEKVKRESGVIPEQAPALPTTDQIDSADDSVIPDTNEDE